MTSPLLPVRVPEHVAAIWRAYAQAEGLTLSEWIRRACASRVVSARLVEAVRRRPRRPPPV